MSIQEAAVEPYKLSELFSLIPDYDGNPIFLTTFINSCNTAMQIAVNDQKRFLVLHIKNKLKFRAAELVNSRNPNSWDSIRNLLEIHFGDSRDLTSLLQDVQRLKQLNGESPLTFVSRLQTHEAKLHAAINKQNLTPDQKIAQTALADSLCLNTLLTGLEPKLAQLIRASQPNDMLTAVNRIRRELQLNYFESQKFNTSKQTMQNPVTKKTFQSNYSRQNSSQNNNNFPRQNNFQHNNFPRPNNFQNNNNFVRPNPQSQNQFQRQSFVQRPSTSQQQNQFQRPSTSFQNPNNNFQRQSVIKENPNPNFQRQSVIQQRTHHVNDNEFEYHDDSSYNPNFENDS